MPHVLMNAYLLGGQADYRSAGIHNVIHRLLQHLPQQAPPEENWRFTACVGAQAEVAYPGVTLRRSAWDTRAPLRRIVWEQAVQPWALTRQPHDLYHALAFAAPLLRPARPLVVTVYDLSFVRYPERLSRARRIYLQALTPLSCRQARCVLAISESTKRDLVELLGLPAEKIIVTPLGYDEATMRPQSAEAVAAFRRAKGLPERFWLFVGTIEPRKNLPFLLQAYAMLKRDERLPLLLGGGGGWGLQAVQEAIMRYNLSDEVRLLGFLPAGELPLWYASAEAFLYPSVFEGFGLPVLEAMACGTPTLTTNVSSLPEVAADAALCLPPDSLDAWTAGLRLALNEDWRALARLRGLAQARRFSWQQTARLTLESYRQALG
ncbi:MAG: glycosyltransferase family 4 protein [Anaerolineae bacterium]|nr:glycosyltransferase family 4 protein [Anaerolineae bacterium]MDW8173871.1 glycosyltransferase family 1 protein [Anaerolineae bacterium]